jgi:hypothetical protein
MQDAGLDLLQGAEGRVRPRLNRGHSCRRCLAGLCVRSADQAEPGGSHRHGRRAQKQESFDGISSTLMAHFCLAMSYSSLGFQ